MAQWADQSFADDAMKEVDEIIGDTLLEDEDGNYLSMVGSSKTTPYFLPHFNSVKLEMTFNYLALKLGKKDAEGWAMALFQKRGAKRLPSSNYENVSVDAKAN